MSNILPKLASEQRGRLVGSILGHAEQEFYADLTPAQKKAFREKVLASVGVYHDFVLDCLRAAGEDATLNEEALRLLHQINRAVNVRASA